MATTSASRRVLLVHCDPRTTGRVTRTLLRDGHQVESLESAEDGRERLARGGVDLTLVSLEALGDDPVSGLRELRGKSRSPLVVICDPRQVRDAVRLMRHGAEDYVVRPPDANELRTRLERILERHDLDSRITFYQEEISKRHDSGSVEARSPAMRAVVEQVVRVAPMRSTVLIYGESGVGKELIARGIHFNSPRHSHPFIALNCAAIPVSLIESELFGHERGSFTGAHARQRGKFEIAHRGTLFLDEISEMGPASQSKLLRLLEAKEFMRIGGDQSIRVDVRVIAATNADLEDLVAASMFRRDLYYRLKVVTLRVPPLRERREDLPSLVETFLEQLARSNAVPPKAISAEAVTALTDYAWPGNVRELKNLMESLLVLVRGDTIRVEHLPSYLHGGATVREPRGIDPGMTLAEVERELIRVTLEHTGGNRTHAASMLAIGVRTLQRKIHAYGLSIPSRRRRPRRRTVPGQSSSERS